MDWFEHVWKSISGTPSLGFLVGGLVPVLLYVLVKLFWPHGEGPETPKPFRSALRDVCGAVLCLVVVALYYDYSKHQDGPGQDLHSGGAFGLAFVAVILRANARADERITELLRRSTLPPDVREMLDAMVAELPAQRGGPDRGPKGKV